MKLFIVTKKQLMLSICMVLALTVVIIGGFGAFAGNDRLLPIYCVETDKKQIAISFDAAWGNDDTQQLIDILAEYDVPATFFVVGAWVDKYPESVKALSDAGHQIQNHSNTHPYMTQLSKEQMKNEIESCNQKIEAVTGVCPTLLRPPYGDYDNALIQVMEEMNMYTIQWDVEPSATVGKPYKHCGSFFLIKGGKYFSYYCRPLKDEPDKTCRDVGSRRRYDDKGKRPHMADPQPSIQSPLRTL